MSVVVHRYDGAGYKQCEEKRCVHTDAFFCIVCKMPWARVAQGMKRGQLPAQKKASTGACLEVKCMWRLKIN